jgi:hypothetical protein
MVMDSCDEGLTVTQGPPPTRSGITTDQTLVYTGWEWEMTTTAPRDGFGVKITAAGVSLGHFMGYNLITTTSYEYDVLVNGAVAYQGTYLSGVDINPACKLPGGTEVKVRVRNLVLRGHYNFVGYDTGEQQEDGQYAISETCWQYGGAFYSAFFITLSCDKCAFSECDCNTLCLDCPADACTTEVQPGQCCPASGDWQQGQVALDIDACNPIWTVTEGPPPTESNNNFTRILSYDGWSWEMETIAPPGGFGLRVISDSVYEVSITSVRRIQSYFWFDIEVDGVVVLSNSQFRKNEIPGQSASGCKVTGGTAVKVRIYGLEIDANSDWTGGYGQTQGRWAVSNFCWLWYGSTDVPLVSAFRVRISCDKCAFSKCDCNPLP